MTEDRWAHRRRVTERNLSMARARGANPSQIDLDFATLLAERDALAVEARVTRGAMRDTVSAYETMEREHEEMERERDAARAEVERLRDAVRKHKQAVQRAEDRTRQILSRGWDHNLWNWCEA